MTGQIIAIVVLILFSSYFSATETAFTSVNKIKLKTMAADGDAKAAKVLELTEKYDKLLTTILIGNNVVNIAMTAIATVLFVGIMAEKSEEHSQGKAGKLCEILGTCNKLSDDDSHSYKLRVYPVEEACNKNIQVGWRG